jgi:hypothetical protein
MDDSSKLDWSQHDFKINGAVGAPAHRDTFRANPWYNQTYLAFHPNENDSVFHYQLSPAGAQYKGSIAHPPATIHRNPGSYPAGQSHKTYLFRNSDPIHGILFWDINLSPTGVYTVDEGGVGHIPTPDTVPFWPPHTWHGLRINLEIFDPDAPEWQLPAHGAPTNNLQTFLIVNGVGPELLEARPEGATTRSSSSASRGDSRADYALMQEAMYTLSLSRR